MSARASVVVLGEALVDEFADGPVPGGAPFNVARTLAAFGVETCFISRIGQDAQADVLLASAQAYGLSTASVQRDARHATGRVSVVEGEGGHRFVIHADAAWDHLDAAPAQRALEAARPTLVYFGSLAQRHAVSRATLRRLLKRCSAVRFLDLNLRPGTEHPDLAAESLMLADWVKVNEDELAQLQVWFDPAGEGGPTGLIGLSGLMARFALERVLVTRGAQGWAWYGPGGQLLAEGPGGAVPALVDTVGAGDGFTALTLAGLARGGAMPEVLALANQFAAFICGERGPLPAEAAALVPWRAQLERLTAALPARP